MTERLPIPQHFETFGCPGCGDIYCVPHNEDRDNPWCAHNGRCMNVTPVEKDMFTQTVKIDVTIRKETS